MIAEIPVIGLSQKLRALGVGVRDIVIREVNSGNRTECLIAYLVVQGAWDEKKARAVIETELAEREVGESLKLVPLHELPLNEYGELDVKALEAVPILDEPLISRLEKKATSLPAIDEASVYSYRGKDLPLTFAPRGPATC